VTPEGVKVGMWLALSLAVVATAVLTVIACHIAWWRPELPDSVQRLVDRLEHYHEAKRLAGVAEAAGYAPPTGMLDQAEKDLAAALEEALGEVGLQPLALPYPKQVALAGKIAEWAASMAKPNIAVRVPSMADIPAALATIAPGRSVWIATSEERPKTTRVSNDTIQRLIEQNAERDAVRTERAIESELRHPQFPKWVCGCEWSGNDLHPVMTAVDGLVDACPECGESDELAIGDEYYDWVNAQFEAPEAVLRGSNPETAVGFVPDERLREFLPLRSDGRCRRCPNYGR
jgi:hypothetical protein